MSPETSTGRRTVELSRRVGWSTAHFLGQRHRRMARQGRHSGGAGQKPRPQAQENIISLSQLPPPPPPAHN